MDSASSSHPNWNTLPNEIKLKIIQNADNNSRLALKVCSLNDHQIVASVPFRPIYKMYLWNEDGGKWHIDITRTMYGCKEYFTFETFEDFRNKVEEEIKNCDDIGLLKLAQETSNKLQFTKSGELLKVQKLIFSDVNQDVPEIINQIDHSYLKYLKIHRDGVHRDILETPQVKRVHQLHIRYSDITNDQLLIMENPELTLKGTQNITIAGVNRYIKKCLLNLDNKPVSFRIEFRPAVENFEELFQGIEIQMDISKLSKLLSNKIGVVRVGSSLSKHQLDVRFSLSYIKGRTICSNQDPNRQNTSKPPRSSFKSVDSVTIKPGRFTIVERNTAPVTYIFDSDDDLQTKLTEEMNKIDYIKHLVLKETGVNWQLCPPNKQVTVGILLVGSDSFDSNFLKQIEPIHLKEVSIYVGSTDGKMYNMPQLLQAQKLSISNCWIQDEDLIRINAIKVFLIAGHRSILTDSGINKFIKKIVTNLNLHDYNFKIYHSGNEKNANGRIEGLDILSNQRIDPMFTRIIVNSPFPEFKLQLLDRRGLIVGKRITAEEAEKLLQSDSDDELVSDSDYDEDEDMDDDSDADMDDKFNFDDDEDMDDVSDDEENDDDIAMY